MTLHIQPLGPLWFAYIITDDDRLLACGRPRDCPIEAVHQAAGDALATICGQKVANRDLSVEGHTDGQTQEAECEEAV